MGNLSGNQFQRIENIPDNLNSGLTQFYPAITLNERVVSDGGTINDRNQLVELYTNYLNQLPETVLLFNPQAASKERTSGSNKYINKIYDLGNNNYDAVQTTDATQPFLSGYIAPNHKRGVKYINGQSQTGLLDFTDKAFLATDSWTFTIVIKINKKGSTVLGVGSSAFIYINPTNIQITKSGGSGIVGTYSVECGKTYVIEFQYSNGTGLCKINGLPVTSVVTSENITFGQLAYTSSVPFDGVVYHMHLTNTRKTEYQSQSDYNILSSLYPEIEGIAIGNQYWSSSNFEGIVDGAGNAISEVQIANTTSVYSNDFESALNSTTDNLGGGAVFTYSLNTSSPISGTQDAVLEVTSAGSNSGYPRIQFGVTSYAGRLYRIRFNYKVVSGSCYFQIYNGGNFILGGTRTGSGSIDTYITAGGTVKLGDIAFAGTSTFKVQIDSVIIEEVGWADSTTIYNARITAGDSVAVATRAAAMWRNPNNDASLGAYRGKHYNGYAVWALRLNPPKGWRIPDYNDRTQLTTYLGGLTGTAKKLKSENATYISGGTNETGFSAVGSGYTTVGGFYATPTSVNIFFADSTFSTPRVGWLQIDSTDNLSIASGDSVLQGMTIRLLRDEPATPNFKYNEWGGSMVRMINGTGTTSVKGTIVAASTSADNQFMVNPIDGDMPVGVVYESGIANGELCWVVVAGVGEVLMKDTVAPGRGYVAYSSSVAGRADAASTVPAATTHFREIGHLLETKTGGTNVTSKIILHFN